MMKWLILWTALSFLNAEVLAQAGQSTGHAGSTPAISLIVGRPTDRGAAISALSATDIDAYAEYGVVSGVYANRSASQAVRAGKPAEFELTDLSPGAACFYRLRWKTSDGVDMSEEAVFRTQRKRGEAFTFGVQGDSHPERPGKMYDADLYIRTLKNVATDAPDFYFLMGDDFSIERLIERNNRSQEAVNAIYSRQRDFLGIVGKYTPLMLVNGNHEQAAKYLLDGTASNFAVFAGNARTTYFPLPAPDGFYSGNATPVEHVGLLRDYYAWEWGDALFVVIDPYWHSDVAVDNEAGTKAPQRDAGREDARPGESNRDAKRRTTGDGSGGSQADAEQPVNRQGKGSRDLWQITLGDAQYQWLSKTLHESKAKFKFVFSHHVSGTGRGGVEVAGFYEWGGEDRRGVDRFLEMRPRWEKPIHDLMRDTGVTIFFQGHDHLYARQELDGVVYQTCPNPADPTFTAFNRQAYRSGDIFPNSGHLRITVTGGEQAACRVEYVRSTRPEDEASHGKNGGIVHEYTVRPRVSGQATINKETVK